MMPACVASTARRPPRHGERAALSALSTARRRRTLPVGGIRRLSQQSQPPTNTDASKGSPQDSVNQIASLLEHNFARPTLTSLDTFRRILKYSAIGIVLLGTSTLVAFEGVHQWVEHSGLAPEADPAGDLARWGWDAERARWTGAPERGGTDPALGWKARHAVRSAWVAQHWGTGARVVSAAALDRAKYDAGAVEARLEVAHDFLNVALAEALERQQKGGLRPQTIAELLVRHASTLERIGSTAALYDAREDYERVWAASSGRDLDAARIALKLGDLCARIGDSNEAVDWWARALQLSTNGQIDRSADGRPKIPDHFPASPLAQRTHIATLSSLSAHYAQNGQLQDAKSVQEIGLALLTSSPSKGPTDELVPSTHPRSSPPEALHTLFIQHRASLLALHLAEVSYALRTASSPHTLQTLAHAGAHAERVAALLTGSPLTHPDAPPAARIPAPPTPEASLAPAFAASKTLEAPARSLLRDARRTAMQAWMLSGLLHENAAAAAASVAAPGSSSGASDPTSTSTSTGSWWGRKSKGGAEAPGDKGTGPAAATSGSDLAQALECYERALGWAGVKAAEQGGIGQPGDGTLEREWTALWRNYSRVREAVRSDAKEKRELENKKAK